MSTVPKPRRRRDGDPDPAVVPGSGQVYAYLRASTDRQSLTPEVQREHCTAAALRNALVIGAWYQDAPTQNEDGSWNDATSGKVPIAERRAGKELCDRLRRGDVVIVAKMDRAFRRLSDAVLMFDRWERQGVGLIACDMPFLSDLGNPYQLAMMQMVSVFAELERKLIAQRTREALSLKKRKGHRYNRYCGYGFRWEKRFDKAEGKMVKIVVRDDEERGIMALIVTWKLAGHGWEDIYFHLFRQGIKTKHGTEWSIQRIYRAFKAELALQAGETRSTER